MAKHKRGDGSTEKLAKQLGTVLEVAFVDGQVVGLGGEAGGLARVGDHAWVALQVEQKHTHPAENVLQYWPWLERSQRRLVLVHAIASDARRRTGHRTDLTNWLGAMMERVLPGRFHYCRIELGTDDEAAQIRAAMLAIAELRRPAKGRRLAPGL